MQIQEVFNYYADDLKRIEECMEMHLRSEVDLIPQIIYHLIGSGGKRFRPLLLLATSELCGYRGERRYPLSVVIEFIHTATLLHDDVIDQAEKRRGQTSANNIWGNAASVLVGDFLYSRAFKLMTDNGNLAIMKLLSITTNTMAEGEVFQLVKCSDINITERDYLSIIEKKSAVLISAACAIGGILSEATEQRIEALTRFGMRIGSAFQITDDALDYTAKEEEFGKAIGKDIQEGKITLPLIHVLKKGSKEEKNLIKKSVEQKELTGEVISDILSLIQNYKGIDYAIGKAQSFIEEGKSYLDGFQDSEVKTALLTIADYVVERRL